MKVLVKSVSGPNQEYEVETSMTVEDLKKEIQKQQEYPFERQTLIFDGKVLKNEQTLEASNVTDGRFMVVMVTKAKAAAVALTPAAEPAPATAEPAASQPAASTSGEAAATSVPATSSPAPDASAAAEAPASSAAVDQTAAAAAGSGGDTYMERASTLSSGSILEGHIGQMVEMGFERSEVQRAMRAAFNNPDRAVEYLMSGIPETTEPPLPVAAPPRQSATAVGSPVGATAVAPDAPALAAGNTGPNAQPLDMFPQGFPAAAGGAAGGGAGGNRLAFLRGNPQFQGLRQVVQNNPAILQPMLAELGRQNPQLLAEINSNQEEFLAMVNEPLAEGAGGAGAEAAGLAQMLSENPEFAAGLDDDMGEDGTGGQNIQVTEEEAASIERLQALGFPRNACIEAFFACDKNESLAANFLLGNSWD